MKLYSDERKISFSIADKIMIIRKARDSGKEIYLCPITEIAGEFRLATSPKQKPCGRVDIIEMYNTFKEIEPWLFSGSNEIDREKLILHLTPLLHNYAQISEPIEEMYAASPEYFYEIAMHSKEYNSGLLCDGHLLYDIAVKRIFGVLLAGESNDAIRTQIEDILYAYDTKLKTLVDTLSVDIIDYITSAKKAKGNSNAYTHIILYLLLNRYGQLDDPLVNWVANSVIATDEFVDGQDYKKRKDDILENPLERIDLDDKYTWKIAREITNSEDITSISIAIENLYKFTENRPTNQTIGDLIEQCESKTCEEGIYKSVHLLSSFVFIANKYGYFPESNLRSLSELTEGKKIIVIGGHINWRNDLKNKYPAFQIFDGSVNTADLSSIQSADFVFLNVSNMSHAMYYKIMSILRTNNIPFDYLGRAINQELCEKEMADILSKHQQKES